MVDNPLERRIGPVKNQAATVDRPCEHRLMCQSHSELLAGRASNVANVKVHVGDQAFQRFVKASGRSLHGTHAGWVVGAGGVIPNDTSGVFRVIVCSAGAGVHPESPRLVVTGRSVRLDNEVIPLGSIDDNNPSVVWRDRDEVIGNHLELVTVDTGLKLAVGGDVDQTDARLEHGLGFLAPANPTLIGNRRAVECVASIDQEIADRLGNTIQRY